MGDETEAELGTDGNGAPAPEVELGAPATTIELNEPGQRMDEASPMAVAATDTDTPPPPPDFAPAAPIAWAPVGPLTGSTTVRDRREWGLVDPGPIVDGRWISRGFASSSSRTTILRVLLAVQIAFDIGLILFQRGVVLAVDSGVRFSTGQAALVNGVLGGIGPASVVIALAGLVALFAWISRVVENIPALTGRTPERSPRESIGWWLVPFASWVVPYAIVRDAVWRLRTGPDEATIRLLLPWWLLRVGTAIGGVLFGRGLLHLDATTTVLMAQVVLVMEALGDALLIVIATGIGRSERIQAARLDFSGRRGPEWPRFAHVQPEPARVADGDEASSIDYRGWPLSPRREATAADDPLAREVDEPRAEYEDRLLAALEAEAVQR